MEELRLSSWNYVNSRSHQASIGRSTILWPNPSAAGSSVGSGAFGDGPLKQFPEHPRPRAQKRHGGCGGDYKADSSRVTTSRIQVWPWSIWLRSCQYIRTANDGTATGRGRHRNPWVTANSFATRDGTVTIRSVRAMISGTLVKWGVSRTICRLTPCCTSMSSTILWPENGEVTATWRAARNVFRDNPFLIEPCPLRRTET